MTSHLKLPTLKQTPLTRAVAGAAGFCIILGLVLLVDYRVGNPLSAKWAVHQINAHFAQEHPDETYVVGPAQYTYQGDRKRYVCRVYSPDSVDTGFSAYLSGGRVYTSKAAETDSGVNTYNRFRWALGRELDVPQLCKALKGYAPDMVNLTFYPKNNGAVFSPDDPLFVPDAEFDRDRLPLPTVLSMSFAPGSQEQPVSLTLEQAAKHLIALKNAAGQQGLEYDYYSVSIYTPSCHWELLDVPAARIPASADEEDGAALAALTEYLEQNGQSSDGLYRSAPAGSALPLYEQKMDLFYESQYAAFQPCLHG